MKLTRNPEYIHPQIGQLYINNKNGELITVLERMSEFWYKCYNITRRDIYHTTVQYLNVYCKQISNDS